MAEEISEKPAKEGGPGWKELAWQAWLQGERNISLLSGQFNHKWETVRNALRERSKVARELIDDEEFDRLAEYVQGLETDLQAAHRLYRNANNDNAKVGALKHVTDLREKLAACHQIVTRWAGLEHKGKLEIDVDSKFTDNLTHLLGRLNGSGTADDSSGGAD